MGTGKWREFPRPRCGRKNGIPLLQERSTGTGADGLMYLANNTRPDIAFAVNLLARHSTSPTRRHWIYGKQILRYLTDTKDLGLFFQKTNDPNLVGYADVGCMFDPHNAISQTGFVFLHGGPTIPWKSSKQTLVATSTNHSEIIALYEVSHECVWLRG
jgi:hypothetical protein